MNLQNHQNLPKRLVINGVPRINFYEGGSRCPEDLCIPSVLRALGEFFGEDEFGCRTCRAIQPGCKINCSYSFFTASLGWQRIYPGKKVGMTAMQPFICPKILNRLCCGDRRRDKLGDHPS